MEARGARAGEGSHKSPFRGSSRSNDGTLQNKRSQCIPLSSQHRCLPGVDFEGRTVQGNHFTPIILAPPRRTGTFSKFDGSRYSSERAIARYSTSLPYLPTFPDSSRISDQEFRRCDGKSSLFSSCRWLIRTIGFSVFKYHARIERPISLCTLLRSSTRRPADVARNAGKYKIGLGP